METLIKALLIASTLFAVSCGNESSSNNSVSAHPESESVTSLEENNNSKIVVADFKGERAIELNNDFSNLDLVKNKLNSFVITASLQQTIDENITISCFKIIGTDNNRKNIIMEAGSLSKKLEISLADNELQIDVNCQTLSSSNKLLGEKKFSFIKSLIINTPSELKNLRIQNDNKGLHLDRLIITETGSLITNGEKVKLNIKSLYSQNGSVETFTEEKSKLLKKGDLPGNDGGIVYMYVDKSFGELRVFLRGTNGDDQANIPEKKMSPFIDDSSRNAVADTIDSECTPLGKGKDHCVKTNRKDGRAAKNGRQGIQGDEAYPGNRGGNSGFINYITNDASSDFEIAFYISPGIGGKAGTPGEGSDGEKGGHGAGVYPAGADGAQGVQGNNGKDGENGKGETSCWENTLKKEKLCKEY